MPPSEEKLFLNLYKDDLEHNLSNIGGLIRAFKLVESSASDSKELMELETERLTVYRDLGGRLETWESREGMLSPRSRDMLLRQTYQAHSEAIIDHEEISRRAERVLVMLDKRPIRISRIMSYKPLMEASFKHLLEARSKLNRHFEPQPIERIKSPTFGKDTRIYDLGDSQPSIVLQPVPKAEPIQSQAPLLSAFSKAQLVNTILEAPTAQTYPPQSQNTGEWRYPDDFDPEEAYLLDQTASTHERAKAAVGGNVSEQTRYDLSSLLVYSSTGRDLTWDALADLDHRFGLCFNAQAARQQNDGANFKDACLRLKRVLESHASNCSRYDHAPTSGKIAKYYANRVDAERRVKLSLDALLLLYSHADKLDTDARIANRVFDYANEAHFAGFNGLAGTCVDLINLVNETSQSAKSEQQRDFCAKFKVFIDKIILLTMNFVGVSSLSELADFVVMYRRLFDINGVHKATFMELQRALLLQSHQAIIEIDKQAQVYLAIREMRMKEVVSKCLATKPPKMFVALDKEPLVNMQRAMDENCMVLELILGFFTQAFGNNRKYGGELNDQKAAFSKKLLAESQGVNPPMRQWVDEFVKHVLAVN